MGIRHRPRAGAGRPRRPDAAACERERAPDCGRPDADEELRREALLEAARCARAPASPRPRPPAHVHLAGVRGRCGQGPPPPRHAPAAEGRHGALHDRSSGGSSARRSGSSASRCRRPERRSPRRTAPAGLVHRVVHPTSFAWKLGGVRKWRRRESNRDGGCNQPPVNDPDGTLSPRKDEGSAGEPGPTEDDEGG